MCERKVVREFALGTWKLMHSLCHVDNAHKKQFTKPLGSSPCGN